MSFLDELKNRIAAGAKAGVQAYLNTDEAKQKVASSDYKGSATSVKSTLRNAFEPAVSLYEKYRSNREEKNWYSGDKPTQRETLARIYQLGMKDESKREGLMQAYEQEIADPSSPIYSPYAQATTSRSTKTTLANTQKALAEWDELTKELTYWAGRDDLNLSDDDIIARVDWSQYQTLKKMDAGREAGSPLDLLEPVGYSDDAMRGVMWAARNPGKGTGDAMMDAVQSVLGRGTPYVRDDVKAEQLNPASQSYNPYAVSGTMTGLERKYGTTGFDSGWLEKNIGMRGDSDYAKIYNAEQFTAEAEAELEDFNRRLQEELTANPAQDADELIDYLFDSERYKALARMEESLKSGKLLDTTRAINYDRRQIEQSIREQTRQAQLREAALTDPAAMNEVVEQEKRAAAEANGGSLLTPGMIADNAPEVIQKSVLYDGNVNPAVFQEGGAWVVNRLRERRKQKLDEKAAEKEERSEKLENATLAIAGAGMSDVSPSDAEKAPADTPEDVPEAEQAKEEAAPVRIPTAEEVQEMQATAEALEAEGRYREAAEIQFPLILAAVTNSEDEYVKELVTSVGSQEAAMYLTRLVLEGDMLDEVDDLDVWDAVANYEFYLCKALDIEPSSADMFAQVMDFMTGGAYSDTRDNEGVGLIRSVESAAKQGLAKTNDLWANIAGMVMTGYGHAVKGTDWLVNNTLGRVFGVESNAGEKVVEAGREVAGYYDQISAKEEAFMRENASPLEYFSATAGSEAIKMGVQSVIGAGLAGKSGGSVSQLMNRGGNRQLQTALDLAKAEGLARQMAAASPFVADSVASEFNAAYEETESPVSAMVSGLVSGFATMSLMNLDAIKNIERMGSFVPEVIETLKAVPGAGMMATAKRYGKAGMMYIGNMFKTAANEAIQEPTENFLKTWATDTLKGKDFFDRDWAEYSSELAQDAFYAAIGTFGNSLAAMPDWGRSAVYANQMMGRTGLTAEEVVGQLNAFAEDMNDPQVAAQLQANLNEAAVEVRAGELLAGGAMPQLDDTKLEATRKAAEEAQARAEETGAALEAATAAVDSANEQFMANPADDGAKQQLTAAMTEEENARKANDQAVKDAQAAQEELATAQDSVQAQSDAVMGAVREQARAEVEAAVSVARDERAAANEIQRESDNAAVIDTDNFISTQLKGYNLTDEDRQRVTEMIRSRIPLKGADNREGSGSRVKFITGMQKKFGVKITVRDTTEGGQYLRYNGVYDPKTDSIVIDSQATQSDVIYGVLFHELTHKAERSEEYSEFAKSILALKYGEDTQKLEADIRAKQLSYDARLQKMAERDASVDFTPLTRDRAQREIVADLTREILYGDEASIQKLCAEQPSVARRILEAIRNFIDRLRGVNDPAVDQLRKTRDLFEKALGQSAEMKPVETRSFPTDGIQYSLPSDDVLSEMVDSYLSQRTEPEQPRRPQGERQFVRQTMPNTEAVPEWIWREFQQNPDELNYDIDSNREQVERGWRRIQENGYDAELNRLMETDTFGRDDTAQANLMMAMALREDDPASFMALASKYNKEGTKAGQTLQARKLFTRMSPTGARIWMAGKLEGELGDFIRRHRPIKTKVDQKARQIADSIRELDSTDLVKRLTAGDEVTLDNQNNRFGVPINAQQQALIEQYGLGGVKRPGIFYNRATTEQRMLEAILATPNPLELTGYGLNLIQRLEYMKEGAAVVTNADLNYIGSMLSEFVARGGEEGGREADVAVARAYEAFGNITPATVGEKARTWRYMAMLTSVPSAIRNVIGNATQNIVNAASHGIAVELDKIVSKYTGARTTEHLSAGERVAGWKGFVEETKNTFRDYFVDKVVTRRGEAKYSTSQKGRVYQSTAVEAIRNIEGFLMSFGDRNVWRKAYLNSVAEQQKLADQNLLFNEDGTTRTHEQMLDQAEADANYATFTEDNQVSNILNQLKRVPGIGHVVELVMPFTGVPANITRRMVQYSPIGLTTTLLKNAYGTATGKSFDQQAFVQGVSRGLTGTALFGVGMLLAQMGVIKMGTGEEEDKKKYGLQTAMGQQYSPFIYNPLTDEYVNLSVFSPAASVLTMGGAAWMDFQNDEDAIQALQNAAFGSIDQIFDASYMSGLRDLFGGYGSFGENLCDTLLSSAISQNVPAILGQLANTVDPYVRNTKDKNSLMQALKSGLINKIPFLRQQLLPEKVDVTGQTFRTKEGLRNFYDPFTTTDARQEPVVDELFRLSEALGSSSMLPSDALSGTKNSITLNKQTVVLDGEGKEAYQKRYGELWLEGGVTVDKKGKRKAVEGVRELMASVRYQRMSDEEKADAIADILSAAMTGAKMEFIQKYGADAEKE